jgi:hypothetical protein
VVTCTTQADVMCVVIGLSVEEGDEKLRSDMPAMEERCGDPVHGGNHGSEVETMPKNL